MIEVVSCFAIVQCPVLLDTPVVQTQQTKCSPDSYHGTRLSMAVPTQVLHPADCIRGMGSAGMSCKYGLDNAMEFHAVALCDRQYVYSALSDLIIQYTSHSTVYLHVASDFVTQHHHCMLVACWMRW